MDRSLFSPAAAQVCMSVTIMSPCTSCPCVLQFDTSLFVTLAGLHTFVIHALLVPVCSPVRQLHPFLEFRAGRMTLGADNTLSADPRRGQVLLLQNVGCPSPRVLTPPQPSDGLVHFMWKDRTSGAIEEVRS